MTLCDSEENKIPKQIFENIKKQGIKQLTDIQKKAFPYISSNENLVIVSPSGTGKTLIAETIAMIDILEEEDLFEKELLHSKIVTKFDKKNIRKNRNINSKTIFLVPLRALAEEKANKIARTYKEFNIKIHMSISEVDFNEEEINSSHILISTYERFRIILSRMPNLLFSIKNVIIDEFHLLGDKHRGVNLETILTTILDNTRLILLSATIENPEDVANWLHAKLIYSNKRLIPLNYEIIPTFKPENHVKKIILNNIALDAQTLVFCGTRSKAEEFADHYSNFIFSSLKECNKINSEEIINFLRLQSLSQDSICNAQIFSLTKKGTAFHHAGLSRNAKKAIEELFRIGMIKVLFCTETLGAGVNLPARDVIILDTKRWNNEWLSRNTFHQIAGRAGRPGYDSYGKCTIFVEDRREKNSIQNNYWKISEDNESLELQKIPTNYDFVKSSINDLEDLEKLVLSLINNNLTENELLELMQRSFMSHWLKIGMNNGITADSDFKEIIESFYRVLLFPTIHISDDLIKKLQKILPITNLFMMKNYNEKTRDCFVINDISQQFFVTIENDHISCSCNNYGILCKHILFVLSKLPISIVNQIITINYSLIHKLQINGYITENARGVLQTTTKGKICSEMGISIRRFEFLKDWLLYELNPSYPSLGQILGALLKLSPENVEEGYFIQNDIFVKPIYEHIILGANLEKIMKKHLLYEGDLLRTEVFLNATIASLIPLSEFLGLSDLAKKLLELEKLLLNVLTNSY
ncbi:MAG: DEAD/DEAH box helicase [Candidatus Thorarchaeota archaeon]